MSQNKIFTTANQALEVQVYDLLKPDGSPQLYNTLSGLPIGTGDNSVTGELGLKVIIVGQRAANGSNGVQAAGPAKGLIAITPDDDNDITPGVGAIMTTDGGDIAITDNDGNDTLIEDILPGMIIPVQATRIKATGTTATKIYALFH